jgi:hypothetical protein
MAHVALPKSLTPRMLALWPLPSDWPPLEPFFDRYERPPLRCAYVRFFQRESNNDMVSIVSLRKVPGECKVNLTYRSRAVFNRGRIRHGRKEEPDHRINGCESRGEEERHNCEGLLPSFRGSRYGETLRSVTKEEENASRSLRQRFTVFLPI